MKLASWNVNGIRAAARSGSLQKWLQDENADAVCLQEIKATPEQVKKEIEELLNPYGYHSYWHPAQKPGYSGVAIYSRKEPQNITLGLAIPEIDHEGRVMIADFGHFNLVNAYFPNSQRDHARLDYKIAFCKQMHQFCDRLVAQGKAIVLTGDFNIAHQEIDLRNPKSNENNAGFLPEERSWMDEFLKSNYIDAFRHFEKKPGHYTWWSYRPGVREKNIGWRLDYHVVSTNLKDRLMHASIRAQVKGSDHCPVVLELKD